MRVEIRSIACLGGQDAGPVADEIVFGGLRVDGIFRLAGPRVNGEAAATEEMGPLHLVDFGPAFLSQLLVG